MELSSLRELYITELRDLYSAENQILKALPKMAKTASSEELKNAFQEHLEQTKTHVERLEQIFKNLDATPKGKKCKGMEGLIEEGKELMQEDAEPEVLDAGLIGAAQRVEHYEMAGYGCVRTYARVLGDEEAAELLQQTLGEEEETDKKLTEIAESSINVEAAGDGRRRVGSRCNDLGARMRPESLTARGWPRSPIRLRGQPTTAIRVCASMCRNQPLASQRPRRNRTVLKRFAAVAGRESPSHQNKRRGLSASRASSDCSLFSLPAKPDEPKDDDQPQRDAEQPKQNQNHGNSPPSCLPTRYQTDRRNAGLRVR